MTKTLTQITETLTSIQTDVEKIETKSYGWKSATTRTRKALQEVKELANTLRRQILDARKTETENTL